MLTLLKQLCFIAIVLTGAALGALLGIYGVFYSCVMLDVVLGPEKGAGFVAVGWVFLFVTVPLGGYVGGQYAQKFAQFLFKREDRDGAEV